MNNKLLTSIMTGLFLILAFSFLGYQRLHKPRIFILHSYNQQMPWVQSINQSIQQVFKDKAYISIRYFYMDTKRRGDSKRYLSRISKAAVSAINAWNPDILIAFDNDAQTLVGSAFQNADSMKIILAGITDSKLWPEYAKKPNISGITEQIPVSAIREVLSLIFRQQRRIFYLSDDSSTAKTLEKTMLGQNWGSYDLVAHKRVKTFSEWRAAVHEAEKTADILLVSVYQMIKGDQKRHHPMDPKKLIAWTNQHSTIPVVGVYESFILDGGRMAIAISSMEQGYAAAELALNIVEKKLAITDIPLLHGKTFSLFINKAEIKKHFPHAQIPVILDAFSKSDWRLESLQALELDFVRDEKGGLQKNAS